MKRLVLFGLVTWASCVGATLLAADEPSAFASARAAIGGDAALKRIQSLHVVISRQNVSSGMGLSEDSKDRAFSTMHVWLQPPSRLLVRVAESDGFVVQGGIDGDRVLTRRRQNALLARRAERAVLRRFALAWLLYEPDALGVVVKDEGTVHVEHQVLRLLHATDEGGFDLRLYFDAVSHRLVRTEDLTGTSAATATVQNGEVLSAGQPLPSTRVPERFTYSDYRRVGGVDLPFSMSREVNGQLIDLWRVTKYEVNPEKFDAVFNK